jgi:transglutaminase-like putative cysteine protease
MRILLSFAKFFKMTKWMGVLLLLVAGMASAQKNIDPTEQDVALAKQLREQYVKDDVAITETNESIGFELTKDFARVMVNSKVREKLMNIGHRADIKKYEFYDTESVIQNFSMTYRNDKKANFFVKDEFYQDRDLFYNDARVKHMDVDFPVQGYSYNYALDKQYTDVKYFTGMYFNDEFPVLKKTIEITVPDWLKVELKEFNFAGNDIQKASKRNADNNATVYTFEAKNLPAFYKESNAPGRSYLYPHILVIAKSFENNGKVTTLFDSTADLYKWYKSLVDMMKDDPQVFKSKVDELTANAKTDEEKIKNIYYWVQDNIRYIAFEDGIAGFKPDESNHVFEKRYGDCKGMANLIKQMLKIAGFDARLTWIGTKHISYDYTTPSLAVDNHMICTLIHNGKKYFLDGTEKYNALGVNAERIQSKEVMIEDGDKYIIEKIPAGKSDTNKETYTANLTIDKEALKGKCTQTYLGQSCADFLYNFSQFETDQKDRVLERYLSKSDKNIDLDKIVTSDLKNREGQLKIDYEMSVNNKVSAFDNEMYVDLNVLKEFKNFELKDRKTNYEFDYKTDYSASVTLAIPTGYKVLKLPQNLTVAGAGYNVSVSFTQTPTAITCKKSFVFRDGVIKTSELKTWNESIKNLNALYNQQITLTKI